MPLLSEVFDLVRAYEARQVTPDIETEVEAGAPQERAPRERFVQVTAGLVRAARMQRQVTTPELAEAAPAAGMDVVRWTVDDRPTTESVVDMDVDGQVTERPDQRREVQAERGFTLPRSHGLRQPGRR